MLGGDQMKASIVCRPILIIKICFNQIVPSPPRTHGVRVVILGYFALSIRVVSRELNRLVLSIRLEFES